jgi:lipoprotein NlpI
MLARQGEPVRGFLEVIDVQGWRGQIAPYAVIMGYLAARQTGDEAAKVFLGDAAGKLDAAAWPYAVVRFLRGEIGEPALLALAVDNDKLTAVRCVLGLDHALKGRKDAAIAHLRWVVEHGNRAFYEFHIAAAELDRLTGPDAVAKPTTPTGP